MQILFQVHAGKNTFRLCYLPWETTLFSIVIMTLDFLPLEIPEFYREIQLSWSEFKLDDRDSEMIVWNNKNVIIGGKSVFCSNLYNIGILYIGDLFTEDNHLVSYEYLSTKGIAFSTYITCRGII